MPGMSACPSCGRPKVEAVFCACKPPVFVQPTSPDSVFSPDYPRWWEKYTDKADNRSRETH